MKPLSQMLEEQICAVNLSEPSEGDLARVKREYDKVRLVAIELAMALEGYAVADDEPDAPINQAAKQSLSRAKDIIGGDK